jgi:glucose-6-phosphate dehydrogenase assembly protein OpcA
MVWSSDRTTPAQVEAVLRGMLVERHGVYAGCVPARTLNLVCVVDGPSRTALLERLRSLGPGHASRTIVCSVVPGRTDIGAIARLGTDMHPRPGEFAVLRETVVLDVGERHLPHLESIVDPLVVSDVPTVVWSPSDRDAAVRALAALAEVVLLDSTEPDSPSAAIRRTRGWLEVARVVDLAWLRTAPWRERLAASFHPAGLRADLERIRAVTVRHHPCSAVTALLLVGWLAAQLEWRLHPLELTGSRRQGVAAARRREVRLALVPSAGQQVPGLAGLTFETATSRTLTLDRAPGGLLARQRVGTGETRSWTLLGASRGEAGILGEALRAALVPDGVYGRAVRAAGTLAAH